jgi:predicted nucleic acid-binding Zn ribbon protein
MKRTDAKSIAEIIGDFMQQEDIETTVLEHKALQLWGQVVGPGINRLTTERYVEDGVIRVKIDSAALRNDLMLSRSYLIEQLNKLVGKPVIREIIFR